MKKALQPTPQSLLDPRTKLFYFIIALPVIFLLDGIKLELMVLLQAGLFIIAVPMKKIPRLMSVAIIGGIFIFSLNLILVRRGIVFALTMASKFVCISFLFIWFAFSVDPDELSQALTGIGIPYRYSWQISAVFRFLPFFRDETEKLVHSQTSRGIPIDGSLTQKLQLLHTIFIPIFVATQRRSEQLAETLLARSWHPSAKKTSLYPLHFEPLDFVVIPVFLFGAFLLVYSL